MIDSPGALFEHLLDVMTRLRSPNGCPWDREQTTASLRPYLIEETYEVVEALDAGNPHALAEELGDLLLQIVFHAQIGTERGEFTISDLLRGLTDKLVRRHPHVFADGGARTTADVVTQWEAIKRQEAAEQGRARSLLDGIPRALPALLRAQRLQGKAAAVQFDWPDARRAWLKVEEEMVEAAEAIALGDRDRIREELGDVLFSVVNVTRLAALDAEEALDGAIRKFQQRFAAMEADLVTQGKSVSNASQEELERSWETAKAQERTR